MSLIYFFTIVCPNGSFRHPKLLRPQSRSTGFEWWWDGKPQTRVSSHPSTIDLRPIYIFLSALGSRISWTIRDVSCWKTMMGPCGLWQLCSPQSTQVQEIVTQHPGWCSSFPMYSVMRAWKVCKRGCGELPTRRGQYICFCLLTKHLQIS